MKFTPGEYTTRDGRKAVVLEEHNCVLFGRILMGKEWSAVSWFSDGCRQYGDAGASLLLPKREGWLNVYPNCHGYLYPTREHAEATKYLGRIACIRVEWHDGEGL